MIELSKEELKERSKYFNTCKKLQAQIVLHYKYDSFCEEISDIEYSILRLVGQAESYNDLPNCDVIKILKNIKSRMLSD